MSNKTIEVPIRGMTCDECAQDVERAIATLPGVKEAGVSLTAEKAVISIDPARVDMATISKAVEGAGCSISGPISAQGAAGTDKTPLGGFTRHLMTLFGVIFGSVLFLVVIGEMFGLFEAVTERVPWFVWLAIVLAGGYPVFRGVIRATLRRRVTAHTLMTLGLLAAIATGEWATAILIVFFMRLAEHVEGFTTTRARRAVKDLTAMAPQMARVERDGREQEAPVGEVRVGETVIVRPGDKIPVDGEVLTGHATVDQAAVTGESMPVEVGPGAKVFAATIARLGSLRLRATHVGADTTFGRVIKLVEEAEAHRAEVQRIADRFSAYYLPLVATVAALTFLVSRNPLATAAVLVVACSCSFALATPMAMLASVGAAARRGLLVKGGKYLEALAHADVLLIDKTGTLTLGRPQITDIVPLNGMSEGEALALVATVERYSEHPLAEAVRQAAQARGTLLGEPQNFVAVPGMGVEARVDGSVVVVCNRRMIPAGASLPVADGLEAQGKTLLFATKNGALAGVIAASDTLRQEVPEALADLRKLGVRHVELLTGDNERTAAAIAEPLGVRYRANLLPEDKIGIVKEYQAKGHVVIMVGDVVNDAPALAQADVGVAMGAAGADVAIEAAHIALMRDDWTLVPEMLQIARRTMGVVKLNVGFTAVYNLLGLSLAALGLLPPIFAAAAQSLPDLVILSNSSRLLRQRR